VGWLTSLGFWAAFLGLFAVLHLAPPAMIRLRAAAIALIGAAVIATVFGLQGRQVLLLGLSVAWVVGSLCLVRSSSRRSSIWIALALIAPILGLWAVGKIAVAASGPPAWLFYVGSSFFLVKAFSLIKDRLEGKVTAFDPLVGAAYFLFPTTYVSGPMHTYGEFQDTLEKPQEIGDEIVDIGFRFVWGLFKVNVLAAIADQSSLTQLAHAASIPAGELAVAAIVYSFVLYFNFSGYTDIVISLSRLLGVRTPENFDWPYLATSIRDFWRRWHITFTRALTAHVFVPVTRALAGGPLGRNRFAAPLVGYLVTFLFVGFWHGSSPNFLVWGAWHACGLIAQDVAQRLSPPQGLGARSTGWRAWSARALKTGATFLFVSAGWVFFVLPLEQLAKVTWTLR
jgi:alginate O-acetyltransferase complex protein AlgI